MGEVWRSGIFLGCYAKAWVDWQTAEAILSKHPGVPLTSCTELRERVSDMLCGDWAELSLGPRIHSHNTLRLCSRHKRLSPLPFTPSMQYLGDIQGKQMGVDSDGNFVRIAIPANAETREAFSARMAGWWKRTIVQKHIHARSASPSTRSTGIESHEDGTSTNPRTPADQKILDSPKPDTEDLEANTEAVNILVVSHGGAIGTLVLGLLGSRQVYYAKDVAVDKCMNASISVVEMRADGKGVLVSYGDTAHLDGDMVDVNVDEVR